MASPENLDNLDDLESLESVENLENPENPPKKQTNPLPISKLSFTFATETKRKLTKSHEVRLLLLRLFLFLLCSAGEAGRRAHPPIKQPSKKDTGFPLRYIRGGNFC